MSRQLFPLALAALFSLLVSVAYAGSNLVAQRSSRSALNLYLSHNLIPGHRYRLQVSAHGHLPVIGSGFEYYTYFQNRRLYVGHHPLVLHGTTPLSITLTQPIRTKPAEWNMAENVALRHGRGLTIQLLDVSASK